jgi:thiol-disulfide isomerase/thioredoxin
MKIPIQIISNIASLKSNTMKKLILITFFLVTMALSDGFSQGNSIQFLEKPWPEIVAQAKKENKLIFMDAYATWCGPCKWMAANIFTNDSVADYYNRMFVCTKFDMEKGEGLTLRKTYEVKAYPTLLFINANGEMVHKKVGAAQKIQDYINLGMTANNPLECLAAYNKKYESGNLDPRFIFSYLGKISDAYMSVEPVLQKYFATQNDQSLMDRDNWNIIYNFEDDMNSREFKNLVTQAKSYGKLYTKDSVNSKIEDVYTKSMMRLTRSASMTDAGYNQLKQTIRDSGFEGADKVIFISDLNLYQLRGDKDQYLELGYQKLDKYYSSDYNMLNNIAWNFLQLCSVNDIKDSKKYLDKACSWAKKSVAIKSEPANNDTYAGILFKLGKKEEALNHERIAIALAKQQKISPKEYEESLKRMLGPDSK